MLILKERASAHVETNRCASVRVGRWIISWRVQGEEELLSDRHVCVSLGIRKIIMIDTKLRRTIRIEEINIVPGRDIDQKQAHYGIQFRFRTVLLCLHSPVRATSGKRVPKCHPV